jgi:amino acid transporter
MDGNEGQVLLVSLAYFAAYCLIGACTYITRKRVAPDYDDFGGMDGAFWPITWFIASIKLILFCWNKILDIVFELPKEWNNERKAKKKLRMYRVKLINEASDEELGKLIYDEKIKL